MLAGPLPASSRVPVASCRCLAQHSAQVSRLPHLAARSGPNPTPMLGNYPSSPIDPRRWISSRPLPWLQRSPFAPTITVAPALMMQQHHNTAPRRPPRVGSLRAASFSSRWDEHAHVVVDEAAELRRLRQRVVYDVDRWREHRSSRRFARAMMAPWTGMIQISKPVAAVTLFSIVVCVAEASVDSFFFHLPTSLVALVRTTLGLLLVFRTNASYERWDGARKMLATVKVCSQDLVRQVCFWFPADRRDLKEQALRYIQAFYFALKVHLRSGPGGFEDDAQLAADLTPLLKPLELQAVMGAQNRPAHILQCVSWVIKQAGVSGPYLILMERNLTSLADVTGGCERILKTPIPLTYSRMTTRFVMTWLFILPLAMSWEIVHLGCSIWLTPPCVTFLAMLFLGLDEVAVQIEEPFTILPLEKYAQTSQEQTASMLLLLDRIDQVVEPVSADPTPPPYHPLGPL